MLEQTREKINKMHILSMGLKMNFCHPLIQSLLKVPIFKVAPYYFKHLIPIIICSPLILTHDPLQNIPLLKGKLEEVEGGDGRATLGPNPPFWDKFKYNCVE
jgi:hypothetical protein